MTQSQHRSKKALPIRVRGMSNENRFFDELTETSYVSAGALITRLPARVEVDNEVHVTCQLTQLGSNFRVVWINVQGREGWHDAGLELIDAQGNIWGAHFNPGEEGEEAAEVHAFLQCQRCCQSQMTTVPEAADEFISDGFTILRPCEQCKASTPWGFTPVAIVAPEDGSRDAALEKRRKGRVAMKMKIKIIRDRPGAVVEDICETANVSANGAYFLTQHRYSKGESLRVVVPYKEGDITIPVRARVVRLEERKDTFLRGVAIQLDLGDMQGRSLLAESPH